MRRVEASSPVADAHAIDMLFLLQESVLVFTETHAMLERLAAREARRETSIVPPSAGQLRGARAGMPASRRASAAIMLVAVIIGAVWALEIIDPAPMDAFATGTSTHGGHP